MVEQETEQDTGAEQELNPWYVVKRSRSMSST